MMGHLIRYENPTYLFCNTGIEHPATYKFLYQLQEKWGMDITWLEYRPEAPWFEVVCHNSYTRDGRYFEKLIKKRKAVPNREKRFCTIELKIKTARRYIRSLGIKEWVSCIGFRPDEPHRQRKARTGKRVVEHFRYPMDEHNKRIEDVRDFWKAQDFNLQLPMMPNGKTIGGNCQGCFWHSEYQHVQLLKNNPEHYAWLEKIEEENGYTFNDEYSYKILRKNYESGIKDMFDEEEYYCTDSRGSCGV